MRSKKEIFNFGIQSCQAKLKCKKLNGPLQECHQLDMFPNLGYFIHSILFYFEIERFH
jgi:hypothetical protein